MKRILVFQCEDVSLANHQMGNKIREALVSALTRHGYHLLPSDPYDPDWTVHLQKEEHEFLVVEVSHIIPHVSWSISLDALNHELLDNRELQHQINPIIHEAVESLPQASNIVW